MSSVDALPEWLVMPHNCAREIVLSHISQANNLGLLRQNPELTREALQRALPRDTFVHFVDHIDIDNIQLLIGKNTNYQSLLKLIFNDPELDEIKQCCDDTVLQIHHELYTAGEDLQSEESKKFLLKFPTPNDISLATATVYFPALRSLELNNCHVFIQWFAGNNIFRQRLVQYGITDGDVFDFIEKRQDNLEDFDELLSQARDCGIDEILVRRFTENESLRLLRGSSDEKSDIDIVSDDLDNVQRYDNIIDRLKDLRESISSTVEEKREHAFSELKSLQKLIVPNENWVRSSFSPMDIIDELMTSTEQLLEVTKSGNFSRVTEVVTHVNNGLLCKALTLLPSRKSLFSNQSLQKYYSAHNDGDIMPASKILFGEPRCLRSVTLHSEIQPTHQKITFRSALSIPSFENILDNLDGNLSVQTRISSIKKAVSQNRSNRSNSLEQQSTLTENTTLACVIQCEDVPACTLKLLPEANTISSEALEALSSIDDHFSACRFLEDFGEVFSCGTEVLGGARMFTMMLETQGSEAILCDALVEDEWTTALKDDAFFVFEHVDYKDQSSRNAAHANVTSYRRKLHNKLCGPKSVNFGTFVEAVQCSDKKWSVLKRSESFTSFIPVWEAIERIGKLKGIEDVFNLANKLRLAWCLRAQKVLEAKQIVPEARMTLIKYLYSLETSHPLGDSILNNDSKMPKDYDWDKGPVVIQVCELINRSLAIQGVHARFARQSCLIESFACVIRAAPESQYGTPELFVVPFEILEFVEFLEKVLRETRSDVIGLLRYRLQKCNDILRIKRILFQHVTSGANELEQAFPSILSFLDEIDKTSNVQADGMVDILGADFPDEIDLLDAYRWVEKLGRMEGFPKLDDISNSTCHVLRAAVKGLETMKKSIIDKAVGIRMDKHINQFESICRSNSFRYDHFHQHEKFNCTRLASFASSLHPITKRFNVGEKLRVMPPNNHQTNSAVNRNLTFCGEVIATDVVNTGHFLLRWKSVKGKAKSALAVDHTFLGREPLLNVLIEGLKNQKNSSRGKYFECFVHIGDLVPLCTDIGAKNSPSSAGMFVTSPTEDNFFSRKSFCLDRSSDHPEYGFIDKLRWRVPDVDISRFRHVRRSRNGKGGAHGADVKLGEMYNELEKSDSCDLVSICAALLDQRKSVPLMWKRKVTIATSSSCRQKRHIDSSWRDIFPVLCFLRVRLSDRTESCNLNIDNNIPRIIFYEPTDGARASTSKISNDILHTQFLRGNYTDIDACVDLSIGFIREDCNPEQEFGFIPIIVLLFRGDCRLMPAYLLDFFSPQTILISSSSFEETKGYLPKSLVDSGALKFFCLSSSSGLPLEQQIANVESHEELEGKVDSFIYDEVCRWRNTTHAWTPVHDILLNHRGVFSRKCHQQFDSDCEVKWHSEIAALVQCATENSFETPSVGTNEMRASMKLQIIHRQDIGMNENEKQKISKTSRMKEAEKVLEHKLFVTFLKSLMMPTRSGRLLSLNRLDGALERISSSNPSVKDSEMRISKIQCQLMDPSLSEKRLRELDIQLSQQLEIRHQHSIDLACLSREMGYLYVTLCDSDDERVGLTVRSFPKLAAQLLIDGSVIEFMDGDASKVNFPWVSAIFNELGERLEQLKGGKATRLLVRSVFGVQSCGKSTVLNTMFGCNLHTSVGRCTRGINMFLVPCDRPGSGIDMIVGLDTEGLCSPEEERRISSETSLINNRMALLCVLVADAVLCISKIETNDIFRETLSIVMMVYDKLGMSSQYQNAQSRLFFLYNQVGSNKDAEWTQDHIFLTVLRDAWKHASEKLGYKSGEDNEFPPSFLQLINIDKDFQRVQQMNHSDKAPKDYPEVEFGKLLSKFNDHIHQSLTKEPSNNDAPGISFPDLIERLRCVTGAVEWGRNFLLYRDALTYNQYQRERSMFEEFLHDASKKSYECYSKLSIELNQQHKKQEQVDSSEIDVRDSWEKSVWPVEVDSQVRAIYDNLADVVEKSLNSVIGEERKDKLEEYKTSWKNKTERDCQSKVSLLYKRWISLYGVCKQVKDLEQKLFRCLSDEAHKNRDKSFDENATMEKFNKILKTGLEYAMKIDPNPQTVIETLLRSVLRSQLVIEEKMKERMMGLVKKIDVTNSFEHFCCMLCPELPTRKAMEKSKCQYIKTKIDEQVQLYDQGASEFSELTGRMIMDYIDSILSKWNRKVQQKGTFKKMVGHFLRVDVSAFSALEMTLVHMFAIMKIGSVLQKNQNEYYNANSLFARLQQKKPEMLEYYCTLLKGFDGIDALRRTLQRDISACIRQSFSTFAKRMACDRTDAQPWRMTSEGMLALLDYEILSLYQASKTDALRLASKRDALPKVLAKYLANSVTPDEVRARVISLTLNAISLAKEACLLSPEHRSPWEFVLDEIESRCTEKGLNISLSASFDMVLRKPPVTKKLQKTVKEFFDNLEGIVRSMQNLSDENMVVDGKTIYETLQEDNINQTTLQPRCCTPCPSCKMPCLEEAEHDARNGLDRLHRCVHQPSGLAGVHLINKNTLSWRTCSAAARDNVEMCFGEEDDYRYVPYRNFHEEYPDWHELDLSQRDRPVREFLFYNCQSELLRMDGFQDLRACEDLESSNYGRHNFVDLLRSCRNRAFQ